MGVTVFINVGVTVLINVGVTVFITLGNVTILFGVRSIQFRVFTLTI